MVRHAVATIAICCWALRAVALLTPPFNANFNSGLPAGWTQSTTNPPYLWTASASLGSSGSGCAILDMGGTMTNASVKLWTPWLDLAGVQNPQVTFMLASVANSGFVPPPLSMWVDNIYGQNWLTNYGGATVIPTPSNIITTTTQPFPPLSAASVEWVSITLSLSGVPNDSIRIGFQGDVAIGGWVLIDDVSISGTPATVTLPSKAILEGAFNSVAGNMRDDLRALPTFPLTEPFTALGFHHETYGGGETVAPAVLAVTGTNAIVDWVLVEIRRGSGPLDPIRTKSALLQRDGDIVDVNGTSTLTFQLAPGSYRVSVRHRNHLGCMTGSNVTLSASTSLVDFTLTGTATYGTNARKTIGGIMALWAGNVVIDNQLKYTGTFNDREPILTAIGGLIPTATVNGYRQEDVNLDGVVKYTGTDNDRDFILTNIGGAVPTNTRLQQLP